MQFILNRWRSTAIATLATLGLLVAGSTAEAGGKVRFGVDGHAQNPVFSKDGNYIAFEVNDYAGNVQLYVAQLKGELAMKDATKVALPGGSTPFGGSGQVVINPSWHPQGVVVFEGSNQGGQYRLYYHQPGGGAAAEMISSQEIPGDLTFPAISSDGANMAFIADATGNGDIRIRDTNTGEISQQTTSPDSEMFPLFTSDGSKVLYTRKDDNTEDVYLMAVGGGSAEKVAGGAGDQTRPVFAGENIVFFDSSRGDGTWDLAKVDGPGGSKKVLAKDVKLPERARPAVSPDGDWVAYVYADPQAADKIMLVKSDGSQTVEVASEFKACGEPNVGVQNGRVLLSYTALPQSGSDWRFLYVQDVTDKL